MTGKCRAAAVGVTIVSLLVERLMYFPKTFVQVSRTKMFFSVYRGVNDAPCVQQYNVHVTVSFPFTEMMFDFPFNLWLWNSMTTMGSCFGNIGWSF